MLRQIGGFPFILWLNSILIYIYVYICINNINTHIYIYVYIYIYQNCCLVTKLYLTLLQPQGLQPSSLLHPWDLPGKNAGVGCHFLLQGIFLDPGIEPTWNKIESHSIYDRIMHIIYYGILVVKTLRQSALDLLISIFLVDGERDRRLPCARRDALATGRAVTEGD